MPITVTLQAASNANMTRDGSSSGIALADDDLRKVYGLPNQYVDEMARIHFVEAIRWDTVLPAEPAIRLEYQVGDDAQVAYSAFGSSGGAINDVVWTLKGQRRPTTTAFQLRCDSISHDVSDMSAISPMPAFNNMNGSSADACTPGQLNNLVIAFGMRTEVIKLSGVLVDEGPISAVNPRKQVLMNIARMQYLKTGRGGRLSWGGVQSNPLNPNSYLCLAIYDANIGTSGTFDSIGVQPNGLDLVYRGLIKSLSFRQEGGRPNQWFWTMEFAVLANEHSQFLFQSQGLLGGTLEIDRIRLVNTVGVPIETEDFPTVAGIELHSRNDLQVQISENPPIYQYPEDYQTIMISSSNSVPKIDGIYNIHYVDRIADTFKLMLVKSDGTLTNNKHSNSFNEPDLDQIWTSFTAGTKAFVTFGVDGSGQPLLTATDLELPPAAWESAAGEGDGTWPEFDEDLGILG